MLGVSNICFVNFRPSAVYKMEKISIVLYCNGLTKASHCGWCGVVLIIWGWCVRKFRAKKSINSVSEVIDFAMPPGISQLPRVTDSSLFAAVQETFGNSREMDAGPDKAGTKRTSCRVSNRIWLFASGCISTPSTIILLSTE